MSYSAARVALAEAILRRANNGQDIARFRAAYNELREVVIEAPTFSTNDAETLPALLRKQI